jgi:hypothetical protein
VTIPGIKEVYRTVGSRTIDTTDVDIAAFTTLIVDGDGTIAPVDTNAEDLDLLLQARIRQRSELGV